MHRTRRHGHGFTLLELIVVMTLLSAVFAIASPQLSRFMSGRGIDEECRRFVALTRYARSQAISRGQKMTLWIAPDKAQYGLRPESPSEDQAKPVQFDLARNLSLAVAGATEDRNGEITILFWPDGTIDAEAPEQCTLSENDQAQYVFALSDNRLEYAVKEPSDVQP